MTFVDSFFIWIEYLAKMKLSALSIFFVALCLGLTVGQVQLRVYRGTLVHSRVLEEIEILQDHLLGFDENNLGEVSAAACIHAYITQCPCLHAYAHATDTVLQCSCLQTLQATILWSAKLRAL